MGFTMYLVDDDGKNVLDCGKWYGLHVERGDSPARSILGGVDCEKVDQPEDYVVAALKWWHSIGSPPHLRSMSSLWREQDEWVNLNPWQQPALVFAIDGPVAAARPPQEGDEVGVNVYCLKTKIADGWTFTDISTPFTPETP